MDTRRIDILSDSTGETAERVVRAAMLQFPQTSSQIQLHARVRTREAARPVLEAAARDGAIVVFTVVNPELREYIHAQGQELQVEAVDLIGSLIGKLGGLFDRAPINTPSAAQPLNDEYFRRIDAVEFAVANDDGKEPRNFTKADVVLCGVSRTSKTPLSTLLAQRGLKVANFPIVPGVRMPPEVEEVPPDRVVGLTIELAELVEIRRARLRQLGMPKDASHGLRDRVNHELEYAAQVFAQHPRWTIIDVTGRAIEDTAATVVLTLKDRDEKPRGARQ